MFDFIIRFGFYILFFLVPLVFYRDSFELFEYNKMMLTYIVTIFIVCIWILKMITQRKLIFKKTPLDLPILLFLISQILSTIFSIDRHTSIWGYYTRSNGGLLSTITYILLYYAFVSNFVNLKNQVLNMLKISIASGFIVSIWGIFEHFGSSFSCLIMQGNFNDTCWVQDVQARVFATLGQPNWMAALLEMILFPTLYLYLTAKDTRSKIVYLTAGVANYMAFTFTYSRGAMLGLLSGLAVFLVFYIYKITFPWKIKLNKALQPYSLLVLVGLFLIINLLFGSALTGFKLIKEAAVPNRPSIISSNSQLDNGGTESGQIRLIVWKGALAIFAHYPILGSGVETFAYAYYNFRPMAHNMTSEWNFLYNKAHNEYLNYLSTTGVVGFLTYMAIILGFVYYQVYILFKLKIKDDLTEHNYKLFSLAILTAYISYLIQNFFQFSVVPIALLFFLFPAYVFVYLDQPASFVPILDRVNRNFYLFVQPLTTWIDRFFKKLAAYPTIVSIIVVSFSIGLLFLLGRFWLADRSFAIGTRELGEGVAGQAYLDIQNAVEANPFEPYYISEEGLASAAVSVGLKDQDNDASDSAHLADQAIAYTAEALERSPANVPYWKTAYETYDLLASINPKYNLSALKVLDELAILAPTDPESYFDKGQIYSSMGNTDLAIQSLTKAVQMKPDYSNALDWLADEYYKKGQMNLAVETLKQDLKYNPDDTVATQKLQNYQPETATASSQKSFFLDKGRTSVSY